MKKTQLVIMSLLPALTAVAGTDNAPLWLRDAKISPDGKQIAFTYKGDIFRVPVTGGEAVRLTSRDSYESNPVWSPDSRSIAFASDLHGNFDVFMISADAVGKWTRLTYNSASEIPETFTPDGKKVMFSAAIQDPASSALFPTSRMTELYEVPVDGGTPVQILATPARYVSWAPDGKSFLYQDVKGFEDEWRKHHTSSVTRDIWRYTPATGKHTQLTSRPGEDLNPVDAGQDIYFLSEPDKAGASINVYRAPGGDLPAASPVTSFKKHPVRFLSRANDGTLCFTYDGELYTMTQGGKPRKVALSINADFPDETRKLSASSGAREAAAAPDGKSVAFIYRGDVYVTSTDYRTTKQISATPEAESDISWGGDSTLYYTSERDGRYNIYRATVARADEEPGFVNATLINEEPMFKADSHERTAPRLSPDGKYLAFILDRNKLAVMDTKSGKVRELTDGSTYRQRGGRFTYKWAPDSKWIALEIVDRRHDPYTDIAIINVESGQLTNLTNSGYFDAEPKWILDGNAIMFASERYGMRNHASWGSEMDVMFVFLNKKAYDDFMLSKEEAEVKAAEEKLRKAKEEKETDKDKSDTGKKDKKDKKDDSKGDVEPIKVELADIEDRIVRVTPMSTDLRDYVLTDDNKKLMFLSGADEGMFLWTLDLKEGDMSMDKKLPQRGGFDTSADGKTIFLLGPGLYKLNGTTPKPISFTAQMQLDPAAERAFMLDNIEREERERFYTKDMHGVDWTRMVADYRKFLPHINNNYDFAELLSEMLGELNVSHTGGRYYGSSGSNAVDRTASLGVLYDMSYTGPGVRIEEVLAKGPVAVADTAITAGAIIEKINGEEITPSNTLSQLLTDCIGKRILLTVKDSPGAKSRDVVVKPISAAVQNRLLYDRWVKNRRDDVERWSNGRLGYVHISSMDDDSFRKVYSDLLGRYNDREGVVIDIRWNGGGRLHEDIEVLFSGEKYFTQEVRGEATCDMPSRRWNKPSIMLMSEACYSNAHGTPWVYKHRKLGKLVGMPVPGTMTSVNWVTAQDPTIVYGIPVVCYRLADGSVLENQQLEPDIKVANSPETVVTGEDSQLRAAVEDLLRTIDGK